MTHDGPFEALVSRPSGYGTGLNSGTARSSNPGHSEPKVPTGVDGVLEWFERSEGFCANRDSKAPGQYDSGERNK